MPRTARLLSGGLVALALACGAPDESSIDDASKPLPGTQPEQPSPAERRRVGRVIRDIPAGLPGDPSAGALFYQFYCASCHGATGDADGPLAAGLDPKPAKHSDGNTMNPLTDAYLFKVIQEGGASVGKSPLMAPWGGSLRDDQIWDVVAYIRTLAEPPYEPQD
jgi:mono/diheme cytochrome c family protein